MNFGKKLQYDFPKMRGGGGQRPFGTFPKIHPFWMCKASHRIYYFRRQLCGKNYVKANYMNALVAAGESGEGKRGRKGE